MLDCARRGLFGAMVVSTILATTATAQPAPVPSAAPFSTGQKAAFADVFALAGPRQATSAASANEMKLLLDAQNRRVAVPGNLSAFTARLATGDLAVMMKKKQTPQLGMLLAWNLNALDMTALDHTLTPATADVGHEQFGPHRTSRVLGMVHLAMFEAVNTIANKFTSYHGIQGRIVADLVPGHPGLTQGGISATTANIDAAITEAAHDVLVALYPKKRAFVDAQEFEALKGLGGDPAHFDPAHKLGYDLGKAAAREILADRGFDAAATTATNISTFADGSSEPEPLATDPRYAGDGPDRWHPDPIHPLGLTALGGNWMDVRPFVLRHADALRPAAGIDPTSPRFIAAYKEVKRLGGDKTAGLNAPRGTTPTTRTAAQTVKGNFWAYDATALLCAPPRLYNEIATSIALHEKPITHVEDFARYLALVNLAMADAGISAWDAKYAFRLGRPATYIRAISIDGTAAGAADPTWTPLGAAVSNAAADSRNLTPPFPAFPSGHAVFGGAVFQILRNYFSSNGSGETFSFISDEYNGKNYGPGDTVPRPLVNKTFPSFAAAEAENGRSRIYLGIHWQFDADVGIAQGNEVGNYVFNNILQPR